jgi:hypothetical protein
VGAAAAPLAPVALRSIGNLLIAPAFSQTRTLHTFACVLSTPVLLMVYNRLGTLRRVWEAIRLARPKYLFISGDGPKENKQSQEAVAEVRQFCESHIDWPCEAHFQWLPFNHGMKQGQLRGIFWFFSQVPEGIVLEDDTLPIPDFFSFCTELLERYREEPRIGIIAGWNMVPAAYLPYQYDFIRLPQLWGWAGWRRAWEGYDPDMKDWRELRQTDFLDRVTGENLRLKKHLYLTFDRTAGIGGPPSEYWDSALAYHFLKRGLLTVFPRTSLVSNLGMGGEGATNTTATRVLPEPQPLPRDLPPPPYIYPNLRAEVYLTKTYWNPPLHYRAYYRIQADLHYGTLWKTFSSQRFWKKALRIALGRY